MNILVTDDHAIVRRGLIEILRGEFSEAKIFEAANSTEAIAVTRANTLDLILLDISMPGRNGMETLKQMRADNIKAPILMLSIHPEDQYAIRALKAGASGFVNKDSATDELIHAVQKVLSGKKYLSAALADKLAETIGGDMQKPLHELLSDRELEVLQLIAVGKAVSEIADALSLSVNTISTYRARILEKLKLHNNAELTRYAIDNNLS
jgi:DNA-binding NarL/FixJ family response regulator